MSSESLHEPWRAHHFPTAESQRAAARLGMWVFLANEVLLFAGLFTAYAVYRFLYPAAWREGSGHLSLLAGTANTLVLITSSYFVAMSLHFVRESARRLALASLAVALLLAFVFLAIKGWEWHEHWRSGDLPGRYYAGDSHLPGASLFVTSYFLTTGLHAIHVLAGIGVLSWLAWRVARGSVHARYETPLELAAMYWHLVDLVWIFLYPLLYLIR